MIKRDKDNRINVNALLVTLVCIIIVIVALYTSFSQQQLQKYARYTVEQNSEGISRDINSYIDSSTSGIQLISYLVTKTMDNDNNDKAGEIVNEFLEQTPFDFIEYVDKEGINYTDMGEKFDASDRVYYKDGIKGNTGIWVNFSPKYSHEVLLNFYSPLYYDNEIVGVITGALGSDTNVMPLLGTNFFGKDMIGILCDESGHIIADTLDENDNGFLEDVLADMGIRGDEKELFLTHIKEGDNSVFELESDNGRVIASTSSINKTGWTVIQIVPADAFNAVMRQNTSIAYTSMAIIVVLLFIYLIYISMRTKRKQEELIRETDRVVQNYEQILITTAIDNYKGIRRIDLENENSEYIYFENGRVAHKQIGNWTEWFRTQEKYINAEDYARLKISFSIENIRKMDDGVTMREDYSSVVKNSQGYYNTYSTTVSIGYLDGRRTAIMTTIDNSAAVIKEIKQKHLLESVASIYISMHAFDLINDKIETVNSSLHVDSIVNNRDKGIYSILRDTMLKLTDEQFRQAMLEFIDLNTLDERMAGVNTITMEFLGTRSGWCRARFIAVDYDDNNKLIRVLWVVENIDAEKKKSNRLKYLSETDLMTGIRNRGSGEKRIRELVENGSNGVFCLIDADKFKSINDKYGHGVGDKVIIELAGKLKKSFRENDVIMRLGGDEFAVFAEGITDKNIIVKYIEAFFESLNDIGIEELGGRRVTVSLGAAIKRDGDGLDFEMLYKNADSSMYESKKIQDNSYTFYEDYKNPA